MRVGNAREVGNEAKEEAVLSTVVISSLGKGECGWWW